MQSDAVVVNQCNSDGKTLLKYKGYDILWIDSTERGLSRSRNMALKNADGEICILCDDDEKMTEGYPELINKAFCTVDKKFFCFIRIFANYFRYYIYQYT